MCVFFFFFNEKIFKILNNSKSVQELSETRSTGQNNWAVGTGLKLDSLGRKYKLSVPARKSLHWAENISCSWQAIS